MPCPPCSPIGTTSRLPLLRLIRAQLETRRDRSLNLNSDLHRRQGTRLASTCGLPYHLPPLPYPTQKAGRRDLRHEGSDGSPPPARQLVVFARWPGLALDPPLPPSLSHLRSLTSHLAASVYSSIPLCRRSHLSRQRLSFVEGQRQSQGACSCQRRRRSVGQGLQVLAWAGACGAHPRPTSRRRVQFGSGAEAGRLAFFPPLLVFASNCKYFNKLRPRQNPSLSLFAHYFSPSHLRLPPLSTPLLLGLGVSTFPSS